FSRPCVYLTVRVKKRYGEATSNSLQHTTGCFKVKTVSHDLPRGEILLVAVWGIIN
ncbi:hypothetical protein NDU88_000192, partial [Pleurodeles waltl]